MNVKILGEIREGSKVTVTGIVMGGTDGSSRVQWFKTSSTTFEGENGMEALSTSKIAKVESAIKLHVSFTSSFLRLVKLNLYSLQAFRIPLGAVGYFIVAKYTPMTPDGESGEPAYAISDIAVESM